MTSVTSASYDVKWEKLPDDFILPDDPVDNIHQPALAEALTDSLEVAGQLSDTAVTTTNYGICATVNGKIVVKAPDWAYIPHIRVPKEEIERSYTPQLQGEPPIIVMEFLSDTNGHEYSIKPTYPPGKWFFYEKILKVPHYIIFEPYSGLIEHYQLDESAGYKIQSSDDNGRYWIPQLQLYLGLWEGTREQRKGYWLRWWNEAGELLLWGSELASEERQKAEVEKQKAEVERQKAEVERQKAERLAAQLRAAGIEPEL